ncbi:hypothetical protein Cgig2_018333 [Carnegiea gigantea]|uniref:Uncharacterized protein n=1 Tax=Carnegiea gigantea TaxID=171969 RepID=A0A9Q1KXV5_9CARY|nr:hypothetical protein Cgig2_018333 [Carnegiea gigantea]
MKRRLRAELASDFLESKTALEIVDLQVYRLHSKEKVRLFAALSPQSSHPAQTRTILSVALHPTIVAGYVVGWGYSADTLEFRPLEFEDTKSQVQRDHSHDSMELLKVTEAFVPGAKCQLELLTVYGDLKSYSECSVLELQSRFWKCPENTLETTLKLLIYYEWGYHAMIHTGMIENLIQQLDHYFARGSEKEIHIDSMDESSKFGSVGLPEAEELVKYVASREAQYDK